MVEIIESKYKAIFIGAVLFMCSSTVWSSTVNWVDWTSTSSGTLDTGSLIIDVELTGSPMGLSNGDTYYKNYPSTYNNFNPSDVIAVNSAGTFTLNFSEAITNPYFALVSVGQPNLSVTYDFSASSPTSVSIVSSGANQWGYGGYTISGDIFTGNEYNGILQLMGTFDSITFTTGPDEYWHGFNIGVSAVPLPAAIWLFSGGLLSLMGISLRKKASS